MSLAALSFSLSMSSILARADSRSVLLEPAHSNDPADPNKSFAKFSPKAEFEFTVTNPDAFDLLVAGAVYDLVLVPRDGGNVISVVPAQTDTAPVVDPAPVDPTPTDLAPTDPAPTDPAPTDPAPVDPAPVDPTPVAPTSDTPVIDAAAAAAVAASAAPAQSDQVAQA